MESRGYIQKYEYFKTHLYLYHPDFAPLISHSTLLDEPCQHSAVPVPPARRRLPHVANGPCPGPRARPARHDASAMRAIRVHISGTVRGDAMSAQHTQESRRNPRSEGGGGSGRRPRPGGPATIYTPSLTTFLDLKTLHACLHPFFVLDRQKPLVFGDILKADLEIS